MVESAKKDSDYLDSSTREAIKSSIILLRKSGIKNEDKIFEKIRLDFDVTLKAIKELASEINAPTHSDLEYSHKSQTPAFAYVLIKCDMGFENIILDELISLEYVAEARGIFGEFDIFVKLEAESEEQIGKTLRKIRKIAHITSTNTLTSIPSQGGK